MALDEPKDTDKVFATGMVTYLADSELLERTGNITIDYLVDGWNSGFTIESEKPVGRSCVAGGGCSSKGSCA